MRTTAVFLSSGDLIADRRYRFAEELAARGDVDGASDLLRQALERAPNFASAWFALGEAQERAGAREAAVAAFRRALACDRQDRHGAALRLARLGAGEATKAMAPAYVRRLFDQYAPHFEEQLTGRLNYRGPELVCEAVKRACAQINRPFRFRRMVDLGCGTGLMGKALRGSCANIAGVDLAPGMVEQARGSGSYDALAAEDMLAFLARQAEDACDLVTAADVFVYVADLQPVIDSVARALAPSGLLAFSVETHPGGGVVLGEALRFAHAPDHVRGAIEKGGLSLVSLDSASTRTEKGIPVPGLIAVAMKP